MKKSLITLGMLSTIISPMVFVISCSDNQKDPGYTTVSDKVLANINKTIRETYLNFTEVKNVVLFENTLIRHFIFTPVQDQVITVDSTNEQNVVDQVTLKANWRYSVWFTLDDDFVNPDAGKKRSINISIEKNSGTDPAFYTPRSLKKHESLKTWNLFHAAMMTALGEKDPFADLQ